MAFLVRKLNKMDRLSVLAETPDVNKLYADIPTTEFRTTEGSLSTWIIESLDKINEAVLAIAITSSKISKMDFIIIDTELLSKYQLEYKCKFRPNGVAIPK